jgi:hypothetical protein
MVRNDWGETAYDAAAAVFEIWICEVTTQTNTIKPRYSLSCQVLQRAEAEKWRMTTVPYNPLAVHTTVPLVLYENQRLDARLKTLAMNGGKPKFSTSGLGRPGRRAPFELRLPRPDEETGKKMISTWRSDVQLPVLDKPFDLPFGSQREGTERSHFWLYVCSHTDDETV